ncbi:MAG: hypothetical protein JWP07_228, partial [Pseudonocardiales bacterium]|nr:hypothetical protein [Pseudonocardiales bacterium]
MLLGRALDGELFRYGYGAGDNGGGTAPGTTQVRISPTSGAAATSAMVATSMVATSMAVTAVAAISAEPSDRGEQMILSDMPKRLFACTPSRLASFDCPRRYRMTYLDRPAPPRGAPWAHNTVGSVVHLALHRWWLLDRVRRTPAEGGRLVERNWQPDGFRDDAQAARARATAGQWVQRYLDERVDADVEPVGVERTVGTTTTRLALSGRVDRIDERDGELVVVDYKTGRREFTDDDA